MNKINPDIYKHHKDYFLTLKRTKGLSRALELGITSGVPVLVLYWWLNEEFGGYTENIRKLSNFYNSEIDNV